MRDSLKANSPNSVREATSKNYLKHNFDKALPVQRCKQSIAKLQPSEPWLLVTVTGSNRGYQWPWHGHRTTGIRHETYLLLAPADPYPLNWISLKFIEVCSPSSQIWTNESNSQKSAKLSEKR